MKLTLRRKRDGTLDLARDAVPPTTMHFSATHLRRLELHGDVTIEPGTKPVPLLEEVGQGSLEEWRQVAKTTVGVDDLIVLKLASGDVRYRVTARSGNRDRNVFDDWHVELEG